MDDWTEMEGRSIPQALYFMTMTIMGGIITTTVLAVMLLRQNEATTETLREQVQHVHESMEQLEQVVEQRREQLDRMAAFMEQAHEQAIP